MLQNEDFKVFSKIGAALWTDPDTAEKSQMETLSAVSLMDLNPERSLETAASALLRRSRSRRGNNKDLSDHLMNPFFRLSPEQKLVMVALHSGRWSYKRLGRILDCSVNEIEVLAWTARLQLAPHVPYPSGPSPLGIHCPEYSSTQPWTQKFLDEELDTTRDRLFLQNHLMVCKGCQESLAKCRTLYFAVEKIVDESLAGSEVSTFSFSKIKALQQRPSERSFYESLEIFVQRRDVQVALILWIAVVLWGCFHSLK